MTFPFIHTADWQIGKPFESLGAEVAPLLREARLAAIDRLAALAREEQITHVLVAGDVLDSATAKDIVLRQLLQRLAAQHHVRWHLISGNHDPATHQGVWHRMAAIGGPANVILHVEAKPADLAPGVVLLPAPLHARAMHDDPTRWMDTCSTPDGTIRIGLAHGSVHGFGSEGDAAVPIMPARVASAGLAFLALGDWHGTKRITDRIWYAGTPEPDQFADNDPGNALVVSLADARSPPDVRKIATAHFSWLKRRLTLTSATDLSALRSEFDAQGAAKARCLLSLDLDGKLPMSEATRLEAALQDLEGMLRYLTVDRERLRISATGDDGFATSSPVLARMAERLQSEADGDGEDARIASRALAMLAVYAADSGRAS